MIRTAGLFAIVSLIVSWPILPAAEQSDAVLLATPVATPASVDAPSEIPGAVPLSLLIRNSGDEDDRLLGGTSPAAAQLRVHHTRLVNGRRVMGSAPNGIAIPAGVTILLEPGARHLMLVGLRDDLIQGDTFPLTLAFERAGEVTVTVRVRRRVDASGITPIPPVAAGDISVSLASAPPAPAGTPIAPPSP